eukprot:scaffold223548_cov37-Prasinocladus_malaysianus.AAC.2
MDGWRPQTGPFCGSPGFIGVAGAADHREAPGRPGRQSRQSPQRQATDVREPPRLRLVACGVLLIYLASSSVLVFACVIPFSQSAPSNDQPAGHLNMVASCFEDNLV